MATLRQEKGYFVTSFAERATSTCCRTQWKQLSLPNKRGTGSRQAICEWALVDLKIECIVTKGGLVLHLHLHLHLHEGYRGSLGAADCG